MFILSNFLNALAQVINFILSALFWLIIVRALISWVSPDPANPIVRFLYQTTEPILYAVRRILPFSLKFSALDIAPLVVLLIIMFLKVFLVRTLLDWAMRL